jgi:hypothetical protein
MNYILVRSNALDKTVVEKRMLSYKAKKRTIIDRFAFMREQDYGLDSL